MPYPIMRAWIYGVFLILLFGLVQAATIHGEIYEWSTLEKLDNVIVEINTVPQQTIVAKEGVYSFQVPLGDYTIKAVYLEDGSVVLTADENVSVESEGDFVLDLIMFPPLDYSELEEEFGFEFDLDGEIFEEEVAYPLEYIMIIIIAALVLAFVTYYFYRAPGKPEKPPEKEKAKPGKKPEKLIKKEKEEAEKEEKIEQEKKKEKPELDKYAREVIEALKRGGNRLTQKELREKVSVGEAKVSLIVSELEDLGLVKKIKRGRGNIIILKKKP